MPEVFLLSATPEQTGILALLSSFFDTNGFMPHGHCYLWKPGLVALHVGTDFLIGAAYVAISLTLWYLVRKIRLPFHGMFLAFGLFIGACGATHFMAVWTLWNPDYWLSGMVKAVCAIASVATGVLLVPLMPRVEALVYNAEISEDRRIKLEAANVELEALYRRMKESDAVKTQFFTNISHELRTPLAMILGPAERLLEKHIDDPEANEELGHIVRNSRLLLRHVNELLDISKLDEGKLKLDYVKTDAPSLIRSTIEHFKSAAEQKKLSLQVDVPENEVIVDLDPEKIQRVILNLVANAVKFVPEGGMVRCSLRELNGDIEIIVQDNGPGIPEAMREAVFERFRQVDGGTTRRFGGTGLGLAIVKEFTALHHGKVSLEEPRGGGSLFRIRLPRRAPDDVIVREEGGGIVQASDTTIREAIAATVEERTPTGRDYRPELPTVLIVEDNAELRAFLRSSLAEDYNIAEAEDGQDGLAKAVTLRPDIILSDIMMPRMSGPDMVRRIREHAELEGVPIVMLTAKTDEHLRIELLNDGAQDYLIKPFSTKELRARLGNWVGAKRAREILRKALDSRSHDLETLAHELSLSKRDLETAMESMRVAREHAEAASLAKSNFLGMVSHELRTPLTTVLLQFENIRRKGALSERQENSIERAQSATQRLIDLVESLLQFARIESGNMVTAIVRVNAAQVAKAVYAESQTQAQLKSLEFAEPQVPANLTLETDEKLLHLILLNLVANAIKYTQAGSIELSAEATGDEVCFHVRDTGPGIPEDARGSIFEPFEQLAELRHKHVPGVGLGLSLVKEMVRVLGGRIAVESEVGKGSVFTVCFTSGKSDFHGGDSNVS